MFRNVIATFGIAAGLVSLQYKDARADYCTATCSCHISSGAFSCQFDRSIRQADKAGIIRDCTNQSNSHGSLGPISCFQEQAAEMGCSGQSVPAGANEVTPVTTNGLLPFRMCQTLPEGMTAAKIYCSMYDYPNTYACNNDAQTSNSCVHTAFAGMYVSTNATNQKTYCWVHHSEDVKRPRDFHFYVEPK